MYRHPPALYCGRTHHTHYREEAAKAAAVHASDPELGPFYREIVRGEDADAARQRRWIELEAPDWS